MKHFRYELVVKESDLDSNGHVNNIEYVRWMQEAAIAHSDAAGCTEATFAEGASWFARTHHIEYLRPAMQGDEVVVRTWVEDTRRAASLRKYEMYRGDQLLAKGETDWVFVDSASGRPRSIPDAIKAMFGD